MYVQKDMALSRLCVHILLCDCNVGLHDCKLLYMLSCPDRFMVGALGSQPFFNMNWSCWCNRMFIFITFAWSHMLHNIKDDIHVALNHNQITY